MPPGTENPKPPPPVKDKDRIPYNPLSEVHPTFVYDPITKKEVRQW